MNDTDTTALDEDTPVAERTADDIAENDIDSNEPDDPQREAGGADNRELAIREPQTAQSRTDTALHAEDLSTSNVLQNIRRKLAAKPPFYKRIGPATPAIRPEPAPTRADEASNATDTSDTETKILPTVPDAKTRRLRVPWAKRPADSEPTEPIPTLSLAERLQAKSLTAGPKTLATLEAVDVSVWYDHGKSKVLEDVSLAIPAGEVYAFIGPSGCGKSTFLRTLNRMHEEIDGAGMNGQVLLDGRDIYDASLKLTEARAQVGMVFQRPNPFPAMSIYDNVISGLKLTGARLSRSERDIVVERSLRAAGLWNEARDRLRSLGGSLSGGQQQRLCIARALAVQPKVLLMDEPCSALDPASTQVIEDTMAELKKEVTIIIVTHNMQQAQRVSSNTAFFYVEKGHPAYIVESGPTKSMFGSPQHERTQAYVGGRFG